jgi:hypothetical protein
MDNRKPKRFNPNPAVERDGLRLSRSEAERNVVSVPHRLGECPGNHNAAAIDLADKDEIEAYKGTDLPV